MSSSVPDADDLTESLTRQGVRVVAGWATNASNLVHAKSMPVERTAAFVAAGAGMSPVHHGYSLDGSIQLTPFYDAVGDLRMSRARGRTRAARWSGRRAHDVVTQDGEPDPTAPRHVLAEVVDRLAAAGLTARVGHELEFVLVAPDGSALPHAAWTPYGLSALVDRSALIGEIVESRPPRGSASSRSTRSTAPTSSRCPSHRRPPSRRRTR